MSRSAVVVVGYDSRGLRLLDDCHLTGAYEPQTFAPYRGTTEVSEEGQVGIGVEAVDAGVAQHTAAEFEYVVTGMRKSVRTTARRSELDGSCAGATHFVRRVYTGAYRRVSEATGDVHAKVGPWAGASGKSRELHGVSGGDLAACGVPPGSDPDHRCSAIVRLELEPVQPSVLVTIVLTSLRVRSRDANGVEWDRDGTAPDPSIEVRTNTGVSARVSLPQNTWRWNGRLPIVELEAFRDLSVDVSGTDNDGLFVDSMGTVTLDAHDLVAGKLSRTLSVRGTQTAELSFDVSLRRML